MNCIFCRNLMSREEIDGIRREFFICESCPINNMQVFINKELISYSFSIPRGTQEEFMLDISSKYQRLTIIRFYMKDGVFWEDEPFIQLNGNFQAVPQNAEALLDRLLKQKVFL